MRHPHPFSPQAVPSEGGVPGTGGTTATGGRTGTGGVVGTGGGAGGVGGTIGTDRPDTDGKLREQLRLLMRRVRAVEPELIRVA